MKTLDGYILRRYLLALLTALIAFIAIFLILDLFEKLDDFIDHGVPIPVVGLYYLYRIPEILLLMLPVGMLLACLFSLGQHARNNEFTAIIGAGISLRRAILPVIAAAFVVSLAALAFGEFLAPPAAVRVKEIDDEMIRPGRSRIRSVRRDLSFLAEGGRFFRIDRLDVAKGEMENVVVQRLQENRLTERIDAKTAEWVDGTLVFRDGFFRRFSEEGLEEAVPFVERPEPAIRETPEDFAAVQKSPRQMSFRELTAHIRKARQSGGEVRKEEVELNMKIAFPFTSFLLVLLGAPLASLLRRGGNAVGFSIALALCFVYYLALRVGQSFGHNGYLPPLLAAWAGNILFGVAGIWLFRKLTNR
ncbi:MAG: LPS export ABC transporter permease LptG [Candidatus Eisenbacteria bacterium]|nr:LPS export ABC transporter permease LptG [Candidatus Eisenbacteria bacterium]